MSETPQVPSTDELMAQLEQSMSAEAYIDQLEPINENLSDYAFELSERYGVSRAELIRRSGINPTYCYQVFQGTRTPGRDQALLMTLGFGANLKETQRFLRLAGRDILWPRRARDAIIIFCIEHGLSRIDTDQELYRLGEQTLLDSEMH